MTEESSLIKTSESNRVSEILNRIGFGKFQLLMGLSICIIEFADGAELTLIQIVSYILEDEWDLSTNELSFLGGSILFGMSLGFVLSPIAELYLARLKVIHISLLFILVFGLISGFVSNIWLLIVARCIVGIALAISTPGILAISAEISPSKQRGRFLLTIEMFTGLGQLFVILLSIAFTPDLDSENWRLTVIVCALTVVPSSILLFFFGYESPLYLARSTMYMESIDVLNKIAKLNKKQGLTDDEEDHVCSMLPMHTKTAGSRVSMLLDKWHISITLKTVAICTANTSAFYGLGIILPYILDIEDSDDSEILYGLLVIYSCQIPFLLVSIYLIEKAYYGRKNSIIFLSGAIAFLMFLAAVVSNSTLIYIFLVFTTGFGVCLLDIVTLYIPEVFETELRVLALGATNVVARLIGGFMVFLFLYLIEISETWTFVFIGSLYFVTMLIGITLPYDTTGRGLDMNM